MCLLDKGCRVRVSIGVSGGMWILASLLLPLLCEEFLWDVFALLKCSFSHCCLLATSKSN